MSGYKPEARIVELIVGRDDQVQLANPSDDFIALRAAHRLGAAPEGDDRTDQSVGMHYNSRRPDQALNMNCSPIPCLHLWRQRIGRESHIRENLHALCLIKAAFRREQAAGLENSGEGLPSAPGCNAWRSITA
jgi:hypothetical protein